MNGSKGYLIQEGVPRILATTGASIPGKMLSCGEGAGGSRDIISLQALDGGGTQFAYEVGILAKAFVGSPPTFVASHRDGGSEGPVHPGGGDFDRGTLSDSLDQFRVACCPQTNVVGKDSCSVDIGMAMDGINGVEERNL